MPCSSTSSGGSGDRYWPLRRGEVETVKREEECSPRAATFRIAILMESKVTQSNISLLWPGSGGQASEQGRAGEDSRKVAVSALTADRAGYVIKAALPRL